MEPQKKFDAKNQSFFAINGPGLATGRDSWIYNFSSEKVALNMQRMIEFYEAQRVEYFEKSQAGVELKIDDFIDTDPTKISWTRALRNDAKKMINHKFDKKEIRTCCYRPFIKQWMYFDKAFIESPGLSRLFFPKQESENKIICLSSMGTTKGLSVLISDSLVDYHLAGDTQCFPLYYYEEQDRQSPTLWDSSEKRDHIRREGISEFIFDRACKLKPTKKS